EKQAFDAAEKRKAQIEMRESEGRQAIEGKALSKKYADEEKEKSKPKKPIRLKVLRDKDNKMTGAEIEA
ncbi:MAG TPA: hypothetical protein VJ323_03570, partial [Bryobacteraceae bacterium]|nr:hypothetical protein [Bryobacteraceae bacterium]